MRPQARRVWGRPTPLRTVRKSTTERLLPVRGSKINEGTISLTRKSGLQVMLSRAMKRSLSIVGAGRVGRTLGRRLHHLGWRIGAVVTRSAATARVAVREIGAGRPYSKQVPEIFDSNVILLTAPDAT